MSLINQMLRDLDSRRDTERASGEVRAVAGGGNRRGGWHTLAAMAVVMSVLLAAGLWWWLATQTSESGTGVELAEPPESLPVADTAEAITEEAPEPTSRLTEVQVIQTREGSRLRLDFDGPVNHRRRSAPDDQLYVDVEAKLPEALLSVSPPGVQSLEAVDGSPGRLRVALESGWEAGPLYLEDGPNGGERLLLSLRSQPEPVPEAIAESAGEAEAEPSVAHDTAGEGAAESPDEEREQEQEREVAESPAPATDQTEAVFSRTESVARAVETAAEARMVRERSGPSPAEQAEAAWQRADAALDAGDWQAAEEELIEALSLDEAHLDARSALADLLHARQGADAADPWLSEAVEIDGFSREEIGYLARQRARMWLDENDRPRAIEALEPIYPQVDDASRSGALLAGLLYQEGRYESAASLYERLVSQSPREGAWWMGLGLAREGLADPQGAREAYQNALSGDGLRSTVRDYLRDRIAELESGA